MLSCLGLNSDHYIDEDKGNIAMNSSSSNNRLWMAFLPTSKRQTMVLLSNNQTCITLRTIENNSPNDLPSICGRFSNKQLSLLRPFK